MRHATLALALFALAASAAPVPKSVKAKQSLNGQWELVAQNYNGTDQANFSKWMWVIDGEQLTFRRPDKDGVYQPSETQLQATLVGASGGRTGEYDYNSTSGGRTTIYRSFLELNGDVLLVCFENRGDAARPTEAKPGPRLLHFRFQRTPEK